MADESRTLEYKIVFDDAGGIQGIQAINAEIEKQSGIIEKLNAELKALKDARDKADNPEKIAALNDKIRETEQQVKNLTTATKQQDSFLSTLKKNWLAFTAGATTAIFAMKKAFDFVKQFSEFEEAASAMAKRFGVNANEVILKLKEAGDGAISAKDAVVIANKALALNVTKDIGQISKLYEIAKENADAFGGDASAAFDQLIQGIGRGTPKLIAGLNISTEGWDTLAKAQGKTVDSQFILNQVLEQGEKILGAGGSGAKSFSDRIDTASATIQDLTLFVGKFTRDFLVSPLIGGGDFKIDDSGILTLKKSFQAVGLAVGGAVVGVRLLGNAVTIVLAPLIEGFKAAAETVGIFWDAVRGDISRLGDLKNVGSEFLSGLKTSVITDVVDMGDAFKNFGQTFVKVFTDNETALVEATAAGTSAINGLGTAMEATTDKSKDLRDEFQALLDGAKTQDEREKEDLNAKISRLDFFRDHYATTQAEIDAIAAASSFYRQELDRIEHEKKIENLQGGLNLAQDIGGQLTDLTDTIFANQIAAAEGNDAKQKDLKRKQARADKTFAVFNAFLSAGLAVTRAFADYPFPASAIIAAIAGTLATAQAIAIAAKPLPTFAQGGTVPGPFSSGDRNLIRADRGETILNVDQGQNLFSALQAAGLLGARSQSASVVNNRSETNNQDNSVSFSGPIYVSGDGSFDRMVSRRLARGGDYA